MNRRVWTSLVLAAACTVSFGVLQKTLVASGIPRPVAIAQPPGDSSRVFIVSQRSGSTGSIYIVKNGTLLTTPFIQIPNLSTDSEQGLLGLAFHPNFAVNRYFYIYYTDSSWRTNIFRYQASAANPDVADTTTGLRITRITQPYQNHNGGTMHFGADGFLYVGLGDGGDGNDPGGRAQDIVNSMLGKMLRLDVDHDDFPADSLKNYANPPTNPYVGVDGLDEIWHWGLRNPWKWAFDPQTQNGYGGPLICDVGQDAYEEIDYAKPGDKGLNFGWRAREGFHDTGLSGGIPPYTDPIFEYTHAGGGVSITGGVICRDPRLGTAWWGKAFFGDVGNPWMRTLGLTFNQDSGAVSPGSVVDTGFSLGNVTAIESINSGQIYFTELGGSVYKISESSASRTVSGTLQFQNVTNPPKGANFYLYNSSNGSFVTMIQAGIPANGAFTIPVPTGSFRVAIDQGTWLRQERTFSTVSNDASGVNFSLINGDVDGDNEVGLSDFGIISAAFGTFEGDPGFSAGADLDRDGEVGLSDFGILSGSFGQIGD